MPSQTFKNLDKGKQEKLMKCAMIEFANNMYHEVSINKIILNAKIPRGSFYMYFKDKDDLFEYILEEHSTRIKKIVKEILIKNKGDLRDTFICLYECMIKGITKKEIVGIYKNIITYISLHKKKDPSPPGYELFLYVKDDIDTSKLKSEDLVFIFDILLHSLLLSIDSLLHNNDPLENKKQFLQKIDIICYGIYKEGKYA